MKILDHQQQNHIFMTRVFLYYIPTDNLYILSREPIKILRETYPSAVVESSFSSIEGARAYVKKLSNIVDLLPKRDHFDDLHRQRLREAKLGARNPNFGGLKDSHKLNMKKAWQGRHQGIHHPQFGVPRSSRTKLKIGWTRRLKKVCRRWVIDPDGKGHLVPCAFILPDGWCYGRPRGATR